MMNKLHKISGLAGVLILLGILIAFNAVVQPLRIRMDATEENLYTLSDGTRQLLDGLERDVTLKFYFSESNDRQPVPMKHFAARVRDLLREYESRSDGYLVVEEYDPKPDSDAEEWARRYGLQPQALDMFGMGGDLYFGIVAVSGSREAVIPMLAQSTEPRLEYMVTRAVSEVVSEKSVKVGLMSALPVNGSGQVNPYMPQPGGNAWAIVSEIERQNDVEQLDPELEAVPDDIDLLVLIHPAELTDKTLYALDQFVLRGGRLLAFTDPMCLTAQESADPRMMQMGMPPPQGSSDLNRLTSAWGIEMIPNRLAADETAASLLAAGRGRAERNPAWLSLREPHINGEEAATASLSDLMLPFAGAFSGTVSNGLDKADLLFTAEDGFTVDASSVQYGGSISIPAETERLPLAVRLSGTFKTAFPDGPPSEASEEETEEPAVGGGLKESAAPGVVVLVADVDLLADRFATESLNLFGQQLVQPRNDNLAFAVNMVEQLTGSEALIGLRSRSAFDRPFDRVIELEKEAAFKWQAEEERLNQKLQRVQTRLGELQQVRDDGPQMILSPEQEKEIEQFREEVFQTQQALKEVRKNLRRDIESLGMRLKAINILAVPLLVAAFGIGRGLWIRRTR